jgi:asparagine synthase (glutamine-hydrolysing)
MNEIFTNNGYLASEQEWRSIIAGLRPDYALTENEEAIALKLRGMVSDAVRSRIDNTCVNKIGIMFSGGLDSSYIAALCKIINCDFCCYSVGFQDGNFKEPEDVVQAKQVAESLGLSKSQFRFKIFDINDLEPVIKKTVGILKQASEKSGVGILNVVNVGVAAVEVAAHSISNSEKVFFSGLGSEEIFAGYDRHKKNPTNDECYNGLLNMYQRDLLRDSAISSALSFSFATPFLDYKLIKYSLGIPINYKINSGGSKMILRKAALPLLGKYSKRPKRAAQYGSSFDRALSKLAAMNGYKYKKEYIESLQ